MSCRFLQGADEATSRRYVQVTKLRRRCPKGLRLIEKVNEEAIAGHGAAGKGGLDITHPNSALFLKSKKQAALLFIQAATVHSKDSTEENRKAAQPSSSTFYFYAAALLSKLKIVQKKIFSASELTFEEFLLAHVPQTKNPLLSVKVMLPSAMRLFFRDTSDKRKTVGTRQKGRSTRLIAAVSTEVLPQWEIVALG